MKKIIKIVLYIIKSIFSFLLNLFIPNSKQTEIQTTEKKKVKKAEKKKQKEKNVSFTTPTNESLDLFEEKVTKKNLKEKVDKLFAEILEQETTKEQIENIIEYKKEICIEATEEIEKNKIKNDKDLKEFVEKKIEKDYKQKKDNLNSIIKLSPSIANKKISLIEEQERTDNKIKPPLTEVKQPNLPEINQENPITLEQFHPKDSIVQKAKINNLEKHIQNEETKETIPFIPIMPLEEKQIEEKIFNDSIKEISEKIIPNKTEVKQSSSNDNPENNANSSKKILDKKEEKTTTVEKEQINYEKIQTENNALIIEAKQEVQKDDLLEKDYDLVEKLLNERITKLENSILHSTSQEQKEFLKQELEKLKQTKKQIKLHKEKELEELRISLEEMIPINELETITKKLKEIQKNNELKEKEILFKNIENKTKEQIQETEKILIKETLKKNIRQLKIPLFLSFPFIKNKFFRRFISGLFIFRSFQFIKRVLLRNPNPYEEIDLSAIQRGSDALIESINITEQNIASFKELKIITLIKYPELKEDKEFMMYLNQLETKLQQNYEKLLHKEKIVNKYFNKAKRLVRNLHY